MRICEKTDKEMKEAEQRIEMLKKQLSSMETERQEVLEQMVGQGISKGTEAFEAKKANTRRWLPMLRNGFMLQRRVRR